MQLTAEGILEDVEKENSSNLLRETGSAARPMPKSGKVFLVKAIACELEAGDSPQISHEGSLASIFLSSNRKRTSVRHTKVIMRMMDLMGQDSGLIC